MVMTKTTARAMAAQLSRVNQLDSPVVASLRAQLASALAELDRVRAQLHTNSLPAASSPLSMFGEGSGVRYHNRPVVTPEQVRVQWGYSALSSVTRHINTGAVEAVRLPNGRYLIYADTLPAARPARKQRRKV